MMYLVHLKVERCQTLHVGVVSAGRNESAVFDRVVKMTVKTSQKCPCVHILVNSQNGQLSGFDHYSYLPQKRSCSRRASGRYGL